MEDAFGKKVAEVEILKEISEYERGKVADSIQE